MTPAPILFLDIDGVLNSLRTMVIPGNNGMLLDQGAVALLHRLVKATGCRIVLSSSWRKIHTLEDVEQRIGVKLIGKTGTVPTGFRGEEIRRWLEEHGETKTPYAIVDDDSDFLPEQKVSNFVHTRLEDGLLWGDYLHLLALLGGPPEQGYEDYTALNPRRP